MPKFTLGEIARITKGKLFGNPEQTIELLETDSRRISIDSKSIFVAIRGLRHDGHNHIGELFERGLRNFLVSIPIQKAYLQKNANYLQVENTVDALQDIAAHYRRPVENAPSCHHRKQR
jgi:Alr-MurF fusion protein